MPDHARSRAERDVVQRALARSSGTLATTARLLGISRSALRSLLDVHGLTANPDVDHADEFSTATQDGISQGWAHK